MTTRAVPVLMLAAAAIAAAAPQRIISLAPNTTEILYGVGAFSQVVAVSQFCNYPPAVAKLPRVGGFETSDIEKIIALRPDLVLFIKAQEPFILDKLEAFSIRSMAVPSESLVDIYTAMQMIGKATGHEKQADDLVQQTRASLDRIRSATVNLPRRNVLLCVNRTPGTLADLYVATPGSYLIDLINIAGGQSGVERSRTGYIKLSKEAILSLNPDVIIDLIHNAQSRFSGHSTEAWNDIPELRAVREKHIYPLTDESVVHPSQLVVHTAQTFVRILHPEAAAGIEH